MIQKFYLTVIAVFAMLLSGCGSNSLVFNPTLTAKYKVADKGFIHSLSCTDTLCAVGSPTFDNTQGSVALLRVFNDGTIEELTRFYGDNNESGFGYKVVLDKHYLLVASKRASQLYMYTYSSDGTITSQNKIILPLKSVEGLALYQNFFLVSNEEAALLYHIETDGSVSLRSTLKPQENSPSGMFGYRAQLSTKYLVIGEQKGESVFIYNYDSNGSVTPLHTLHPSIAKDSDHSLEMALDEDRLLLGLHGAALYRLSNESNISEEIIIPMEGADTYYAGRSVAINNKYLLIEDRSGNSLYSIKGDKIEPLSRVNDTKSTYNLTIEGSALIKNAYTKIHYIDGELYHYTFYPEDKIYVYNRPKTAIVLAENEAPALLFDVDAFSNNGSLSYRIEGEASQWFEMNASQLLNTQIFDYENPFHSDNRYKIDIIVEDAHLNHTNIAITIAVEDHDYIYNAIYNMAGEYIQMLSHYKDTILLSVFQDEKHKINLMQVEENSIVQTNSIFSPRVNDNGFGVSAAKNEHKLLISAVDENISEDDAKGIVFCYAKDLNGSFSLIKSITGDNSIHSSRFGSAIAMDDKTIAIGADHKYARETIDGQRYGRSGEVYIYNENISQIQKLTPNINTRDMFGASIALWNNIMAIGAPNETLDEHRSAGKVYLYKKGEKGLWSLFKELATEKEASDKFFGTYLALNNNFLIISGTSGVSIYLIDTTTDTIALLDFIKNNVSQDPLKISLDNSELFISEKETIHYRLNNTKIKKVETISSRLVVPPRSFVRNFIAMNEQFVQLLENKLGMIVFKKENP